MNRTVIAIENSALLAQVCSALDRAGISTKHRCTSGALALRAVKRMGGGVVLASFKLSDMTANELCEALGGGECLAVIAKPASLALLDRGEITRLPLPLKRTELIETVRALAVIDARRAAPIPRRAAAQESFIAAAKELLIARRGMTEPEAHRYLQRCSMSAGVPMADFARKIAEEESV